jgi:chorismate-pyruvate lyase
LVLIDVERAGSEPAPWSLRESDPMDRVMLASDGTVTRLLESCTAEPIDTVLVGHRPVRHVAALADELGDSSWQFDTTALALPPDAELTARRVVLQGRRSHVPYVLADSLLVVDRLPAGIPDRLRRPGASLGRLLSERAVESRRTILGVGRSEAAAAARHLVCARHDELAWRSYGIVVGGLIAALILERFVPGRLSAVPTAAMAKHE